MEPTMPQDQLHDMSSDFRLGAAFGEMRTALSTLAGRIDRLENRTDVTDTKADIAIDISERAARAADDARDDAEHAVDDIEDIAHEVDAVIVDAKVSDAVEELADAIDPTESVTETEPIIVTDDDPTEQAPEPASEPDTKRHRRRGVYGGRH